VAAPAPNVVPSPRGPSLADELAVLDGAKRLLDAGDSLGALVALDRYGRAFPRGHLAPEALALQVEAFERHGDHALAEAHYRRLVALYPDAPSRERLAMLLGAAAP